MLIRDQIHSDLGHKQQEWCTSAIFAVDDPEKGGQPAVSQRADFQGTKPGWRLSNVLAVAPQQNAISACTERFSW